MWMSKYFGADFFSKCVTHSGVFCCGVDDSTGGRGGEIIWKAPQQPNLIEIHKICLALNGTCPLECLSTDELRSKPKLSHLLFGDR